MDPPIKNGVIVESCEAEGDFILPVVQILPKLDMNNPYLADTCMYTVGALAEWLMDRVEFLPILLPIVMPGLKVKPGPMTPFFGDLLYRNWPRNTCIPF